MQHEKILHTTKLFQLIERSKSFDFEFNGEPKHKDLTYTLALRPPGVRAIIRTDTGFILSQEFRYELGRFDLRLPGGKVFDDIASYRQAMSDNAVNQAVDRQLVNEVREEVSIDVKKFDLFKKTTCGFSIEWDLYYFLVTDFTMREQDHVDEFECINRKHVSIAEAKALCLNGEISEERSAMVLLQYINQMEDNQNGN